MSWCKSIFNVAVVAGTIDGVCHRRSQVSPARLIAI
jgi:hypothetical protein